MSRLLGTLLVSALGCAGLASRGEGSHRRAGIPLRLMTYNIRSGNGNIAGTAEAIRATAPDVVALQEVDVHWAERSGFADEAAELGNRLGMQVRFARIYRLPGASPGAIPREFGVALLSRYPIVSWSNDSLTRLSTQEANPVPAQMPGLLEARVNVRGTTIRVFNTHLDYRRDPAVRERQVREMLDRIRQTSMPTIVFGDMNAQPRAAELRPLLDQLRDVWSGAAGTGFTYPAAEPTERIDYILVSRGFRVFSAAVPVTEASDHRPVVAEVELEVGPPPPPPWIRSGSRGAARAGHDARPTLGVGEIDGSEPGRPLSRNTE